MNKDIKMIFFDIDGTLIDMERKFISEEMLETLRSLNRKNIRLCLATGRSPISLPHFEGIRFDAFLTYNGSYCYHHHQTILSTPIPACDVQTVIRNAAALRRPAALASKLRIAANGRDGDLAEYFSLARLKLEIADDFDALANEEIYQIMLGCGKSDYPAVMKGVENAKITAWWDRAVDIIPANSGKGTGVEKILAHYHLTPSEALAFGDGDNDIEMLQAVGWGVAMGNASATLKRSADEVCQSVREEGIRQYCRKYGLI